MNSKLSTLEELVQAVQAGERYRTINVDLVRRVGAQELAKGRSFKEAVKATRNKLHQVGGAYQETAIPYTRLLAELDTLPRDLSDPVLQSFCRRVMQFHTSTRERLPVLESFFKETLAEIGPLHSVLDLACGFNPLALPWMPLAPGAQYFAGDIYGDLVELINHYFRHVGMLGGADLIDLIQGAPIRPAQVALLLKTIPCLEQVDKSIGLQLLEQVTADYLLVSFPAHSLGGQSKGMVQNYEAHFRELVAGKPWQVKRFEFPGELVFLVRKN